MENLPTQQPQQKTQINPVMIGQWIVLGAGVFAMYKLFKGLGLIQSQQDQEAEKLNDKVLFQDYTKPTFWKQIPPAGKKVVTFSNWENWITELEDSTANILTSIFTIGIVQDEEEKMLNLIRQIEYKCQYSFLADKFQQKYGEDMTGFLKNYFNETELYPAWKHLEKLPTYANK